MSSFDRLCWFADRCPTVLGPTLQGILRSAALFVFPHVPQEVLPKNYTKEELDFQQEFFCLPFSVTAIEDRTSCVIFWDTTKDASGLSVRRYFLECASLSDASARTWKDADEEMALRAKSDPALLATLNRSHHISFGSVEVNIGPSVMESDRFGYNIAGQLFHYLVFDNDGVNPRGYEMFEAAQREVTSNALRSAMTGIEELMLFNRPDRFILRDTPPKLRAGDAEKIPRSHERHNYTILHPQEIRTRLDLPTPTSSRSSKFVGERRRHVRRYPDDPIKWPNAHGKTIIIPATWIGPSEATVGRRTYKIMLDL